MPGETRPRLQLAIAVESPPMLLAFPLKFLRLSRWDRLAAL
jgi:hypothetical protein